MLSCFTKGTNNNEVNVGKQRICPICNEPISADEPEIKYKTRYVHQRCFNIQMKNIDAQKKKELKVKAEEKKVKKRTTKPKAELKDAVSEEDYQEKKRFYEKIRSLTGEDSLPTKIYALVDKYISRYAYTFKGMYQTLIYLELQDKELTGDVVGLIPYYYSDAEKYYSDVDNLEKQMKNVDIGQMYKEKVIVIKPKQRVPKQLDFD